MCLNVKNWSWQKTTWAQPAKGQYLMSECQKLTLTSVSLFSVWQTVSTSSSWWWCLSMDFPSLSSSSFSLPLALPCLSPSSAFERRWELIWSTSSSEKSSPYLSWSLIKITYNFLQCLWYFFRRLSRVELPPNFLGLLLLSPARAPTLVLSCKHK